MPTIVYWVVLLVVAAVVFVARHLAVHRSVSGPVPDVDPFGLATVANGAERVAMLVIVQMVQSGEMVVDDNRLRLTESANAITDRLRLAVLPSFRGATRQYGSVLRNQARRRPEMHTWEPPMRRVGLLARRGQRIRIGLISLPLVLVTVLAVIGFVTLHNTVGLWFLLLWPVTLILLVVSVAQLMSPPHSTSLGRAAVRRARQAQKQGLPDEVTVEGVAYPADLFVMAVRGKAGIKDPELREVLYGKTSQPSRD